MPVARRSPCVPIRRRSRESPEGALDLILHILYAIARWRVGVMLVFFALPIAGMVIFGRFLPRGWLRSLAGILTAALVAAALLNLEFGADLSARLVFSRGLAGEGTITGTFATGIMDNNHDVVGYRALLRADDGSVSEATFHDDDFIVYPPLDGIVYPQMGDRFNVRYLASFPRDFVIVSNDNSPWALSLSCGAAMTSLAEAKAKYEFETSSPAYRDAYADALAAAANAGCGGSDAAQAFRVEEASIRSNRQ